MDLGKVSELHKKVAALAEYPGFTEIQRAFIEQLGEELSKLLLARQLNAEVKAEAAKTLDFARHYCEEIRRSLESRATNVQSQQPPKPAAQPSPAERPDK